MSSYGVIKFQAPFERLKEYDFSPEVRLYKAILTQAMIDISNVSPKRDYKVLELAAKNWIFGNSEYFKEVCYNAEIEPGFVIRIAREVIRLNSRNRISSNDDIIKKYIKFNSKENLNSALYRDKFVVG